MNVEKSIKPKVVFAGSDTAPHSTPIPTPFSLSYHSKCWFPIAETIKKKKKLTRNSNNIIEMKQ